jgi:hypothetical protein
LYVGAEDVPILLANQFGIVYDPNGEESVLTVGQLSLPVLIGTDEDKQRQLEQLSYVAIKVVGRYSLTRPRVEALVQMLQQNLERSESPKE